VRRILLFSLVEKNSSQGEKNSSQGEKNSSHGEKKKKSSHGEKNSSHMRKNFLTFLTLRFRLKISLTESGAGWRESFLTRHNKEMFK
jgi:hypothetical protein